MPATTLDLRSDLARRLSEARARTDRWQAEPPRSRPPVIQCHASLLPHIVNCRRRSLDVPADAFPGPWRTSAHRVSRGHDW